MNYIKQALIVTALFSCMSTLGYILEKDHPKPSPRATHIAKCAGYSTVTLINTALTYLIAPQKWNDLKKMDPNTIGNLYIIFALTWLSKHTIINAYKEYKQAFPSADKDVTDETTK